MCWTGNLRGREGSEEVEKRGQEDEEETVFWDELSINFAVGGKIEACTRQHGKNTVQILRWHLKLTVKSEGPSPVGQMKKRH